ncbi:MAG: hypothetical protein Kow0047_34150 [Anaerolineae bacterium]
MSEPTPSPGQIWLTYAGELFLLERQSPPRDLFQTAMPPIWIGRFVYLSRREDTGQQDTVFFWPGALSEALLVRLVGRVTDDGGWEKCLTLGGPQHGRVG